MSAGEGKQTVDEETRPDLVFLPPQGGAIRDGVSRTFCDHSQSPNHCTDAHCNKAYIALFSVAAAYFLISGLLVRLIRNIK